MAPEPDAASAREVIADEDWLYRRIALNHLRSDGRVNRTAFMRNSTPPQKGKEPDPDVSVDLARLTTPRRSLEIAGRPEQGIGALRAGYPRSLGLEVEHSPLPQNRAHSSIAGNIDDRAMERCQLMAEEMSKHLLIVIAQVGVPTACSGDGPARVQSCSKRF